MMKKIAIFMGDTSGEFQTEIVEAIEKEAEAKGTGVHVFTNAGVYGANVFYTQGEKNIIHLPYLADYDGIIVAGDTLGVENMYEELADLLEKEANCPVVCLRQKDERFSNVLVDDYSGMCTMVEHFVEQHGFKRVYFMTGRLEMLDAQQRLLAYIDTMAKYGLKVTSDMVFEGDYWSNLGDAAVEWFLKDPDNWPEAIVCSNDYMAIAVCNALNKRGVKIPEQICVSGFDDIEDAKYSIPPLTTLELKCGELGVAAFSLIEELIETKEEKKNVLVKVHPIYRDSCCSQKQWDMRSIKKLLTEKEYIKQVYYTMTSMGIAFQSEDDFESLAMAACAYISRKKYGQIYICQCVREVAEQDSSALQERYSEKMTLRAIMQNDVCEFTDITFNRREILPKEYVNPDELIFIHPLHGQNKCLGYVVMKNCDLVGLRYFLTRWIQEMGSALEKQVMYEESKELMEMRINYHRDALTGIGNRREMDNVLRKYSNALPITGGFCIISVDMDDLKLINDYYGHLEGDVALCEVARILKEVAGEKGVATRIGGDEFLLCLQTNRQEEAEDTVAKIRERIDAFNNSAVKTWYLHASIGYAFCRNRNSILLTMEQADKNMYEEKRIWKSKRKYRGELHEQ